MKFKMDAQTYDDLNIFSSNKSMFSVFGLFKKVKTIGARERLEEMMRSPSNNINDLIQRRDSIEFFNTSALEIDINHTQFDLILHYLKYDKGYLRNNLIDSAFAYISNKIKSNQDYYVVVIGLEQLGILLRYSTDLIPILTHSDSPQYLKKLGNTIKTILDHPDVRSVSILSSRKKLHFYQLSKLDTLIRRKNTLKIIELLDIFYELDIFETLSNVLRDKDFCLPTYTNDENINIQVKGLYHPNITRPVTNDLTINNKNNIIFLSGSNMAGKSSLLKSIGIAVYLSHIGFPIPAQELRTVPFNGLITTINLADNIQNGLSHYLSEVVRVKQIASTLIETNRIFTLLDELFKGTNAQDAHNGSLMVINAFSEIQDSIFIISSHITELATKLEKENICFKYLENLMINEEPKFTYLLKEGISHDGIGMYFIHKENILKLLNQAKIAHAPSSKN